MNRDRWTSAALAAGLVLSVTACVFDDAGGTGHLRVLAGSELADLEPLLQEVAEESGVTVHMDYVGTLDGVDMVRGGETADRYDAIWFSSNRYLNLYPESREVLSAETPVMASPVVLGVRASAADRLGWQPDTEVTWSDIAEAAADGELSYGMTSPAASNSGFTALVGVASALADTGTALESGDVAEVTPALTEFFSGQRLTAGSSGWLADEYVRRAGRDELDGMINYESVLLSLEESGHLAEPMRVVYPADGAITADYPLSLLDTATEEAAEDYRALVDHLTSPEVQEQISAQTYRRPLTPDGRGATQDFPAVTELPFPARAEVVDQLVAAYFDRIRRPARTVYVLDVSYSMEGERIESLRTAMHTLAGADQDSLAGRHLRFYGREEVTLIAFDGAVRPPRTFTVPAEDPDPVLADISETVDGLPLGSATAVYDALVAAYDELGDVDEDRFTSIVLLTDGEVNEGRDFAEFRDGFHARLPEEKRDVPVFTVLFGEANTAELTELSELAGGQVFDARRTPLAEVFREIRGYQ